RYPAVCRPPSRRSRARRTLDVREYDGRVGRATPLESRNLKSEYSGSMTAKTARSDPFAAVRRAGRALPNVEASTKYDGSPVLKLGGAFMAGLATHPSAEPDSLIVRVALEDRECFVADAPDTYYLTPYYRNHPVVLLRLSRID